MPIVTVDGIGFGVGTWWNNESVILLFLDGAALTVKLLQDLVGLFTTHNKNKVLQFMQERKSVKRPTLHLFESQRTTLLLRQRIDPALEQSSCASKGCK